MGVVDLTKCVNIELELKALCHDIRRNCFLMSSFVRKSN